MADRPAFKSAEHVVWCERCERWTLSGQPYEMLEPGRFAHANCAGKLRLVPVGGFVELRGLDRFVLDGLELSCIECNQFGVYFDSEGYGTSLRRVVVLATDHLAECAGGAS